MNLKLKKSLLLLSTTVLILFAIKRIMEGYLLVGIAKLIILLALLLVYSVISTGDL